MVKISLHGVVQFLLFGLALLLVCKCGPAIQQGSFKNESSHNAYYTEDDFVKVQKFDSHVHLNTYDAAYIRQAQEDNFRFLDIVDDRPFGITMDDQQKIALRQVKAFPGTVFYAATFSTKHFDSPRWQEETLAAIKRAVDSGAVAVKIWKNIGMGLKDKDGRFVMADDPRFDVIIHYLEQHHIPLIGHLGEPRNAWLPLDSMTVNGDRNYFGQHPEYHMYLHAEYPSYEAQVRARERLLEKHPRLRFIGAHLGSLEWNLHELAKTLDRFPNMAVDLARMSHLHLHAKTEWQQTRDFFIRYQDRLIYATDPQVNDTKDTSAMKRNVHDSHLYHWKFFVTDAVMHDPDVSGTFNGLHLPREVVDKIYRKNAERWLPGIIKTGG